MGVTPEVEVEEDSTIKHLKVKSILLLFSQIPMPCVEDYLDHSTDPSLKGSIIPEYRTRAGKWEIRETSGNSRWTGNSAKYRNLTQNTGQLIHMKNGRYILKNS